MFIFHATKLSQLRTIIPSVTAVRFRKIPKRKPTWLPMAASKMFRIPDHPEVSPDEKLLVENLLQLYSIRMDSIRKAFQEEMKQNAESVENIRILKEKEEEEFRLLLAENEKENERIRVVREEVFEREFQEQLLQLTQMAEESQLQTKQRKLEVEEIVRKEKEKAANYITLENLDAAVEKAIDNPVNYCFSLSLDGSVMWEGKPSAEFEKEIQRRISKSLES